MTFPALVLAFVTFVIVFVMALAWFEWVLPKAKG